ncbi:GIN domain-containing protein [Aquimarina sp. 2304DJ70-9]|uniref:GIN domain-containing protein n=1 Tax=Aquimarina penaris TaxID=3231044 RepID=UPI0034632868
MKKSNLMVLGALGATIFFFSAFQFSIHSYVEKGAIEDVESGDFISEIKTIPMFRKISVHHGIQVFFRQDSMTQVRVEAPRTLMPYIRVKVEQEKLILEKTKRMQSVDSIVIHITNPELDELYVLPDGHFRTIGMVSGKDLKLEFSDDSKGKLELSYESVKCKASSESKVVLNGNSKNIDFSN